MMSEDDFIKATQRAIDAGMKEAWRRLHEIEECPADVKLSGLSEWLPKDNNQAFFGLDRTAKITREIKNKTLWQRVQSAYYAFMEA